MDFFNFLSLIGGLSLFLFGMSVMGSALEKRAGGSLKTLLARLTSGRMAGFLTGLGVTAVIQSSSATTVMVVGFVNSGLMTLRQAINVIVGANVGTTVTAWILSLTGIQSGNVFVQLLKPSSFTPVLALVGIVLYMGARSGRKKDTGLILLGFATLMFGMEAMASAVSGLRDVPEFRNMLLVFTNPLLGVLAGALLTAVIQSSSASVGILQALSSTGQVTYGAAIPIIMGQNIGTCVTALLSAVGANKNAKRAALVHLCFNIIGTAVWLTVFVSANALLRFSFVQESVGPLGIAVVHTTFNLLCTALMLPATGLLEKLSYRLIPDRKRAEAQTELDERLMATPTIAVERCRVVTETMAADAAGAWKDAVAMLQRYDAATATKIRAREDEVDHYEDILGTYLVKLGAHEMSDQDSTEAVKLLHMIGDLERISDHAVNILESAEELREKKIHFSKEAERELGVLCSAVLECMDLAMTAFLKSDLKVAVQVEPLEQVVDMLKTQLRSRHILRLQRGECSIEMGFVWSDLLTDLERTADHCSNIAGCVIEMSHDSLDLHAYLGGVKAGSQAFLERYDAFAQKYALLKEPD
ncbi:MAG: Na/Pi cotransporter family protein [Oscillospiraceae bacterium]|nr:Na/Pi cotransporter family protein [Oscillospiraceae bacterium]